MGSKGGGTTVQSNAPPAEVMANYRDVTQQAKNVAATPYTPYMGQMTADLTDTQKSGISNVNAAQNTFQPYYTQASNLINQGTQKYTPTEFNQGELDKYMNPYNQSVIDATMANINQENGKQQSSLQGNAISSGAWGGDRADLARNDLARQQALASGQIIAGLNNQNYNQALGQYNTANQTGMNAAALNNQTALSGAQLQGALGSSAQENALSGANAQLQAGTLEQATKQDALTAAYQQFLQQQQYPFQTTQFLSNIATGLGSQMGGSSTSTAPGQNQTGQIIGTGVTAAAMFF